MKIVGRKLWNVKKRKMFLLERKCIIKEVSEKFLYVSLKSFYFSFKFKLIIILKKLTNSIEQKERSLNRFELSKISLITVIASILCKTCATPVTLTIPPSRICFTRGENFNLKKTQIRGGRTK